MRKSQQQLAGGLACHQSVNPRMRYPSHTAWNPKTTGLALSPHDVPSFRSSLVDPSQAQDFDWQLLKGWEGAQGSVRQRLSQTIAEDDWGPDPPDCTLILK